jgi:hypothetical protein
MCQRCLQIVEFVIGRNVDMAVACVHVMELEERLRLAYEDFLKKEHLWITRIILLVPEHSYHGKVFFHYHSIS